jgi:hypothetical protein
LLPNWTGWPGAFAFRPALFSGENTDSGAPPRFFEGNCPICAAFSPAPENQHPSFLPVQRRNRQLSCQKLVPQKSRLFPGRLIFQFLVCIFENRRQPQKGVQDLKNFNLTYL